MKTSLRFACAALALGGSTFATAAAQATCPTGLDMTVFANRATYVQSCLADWADLFRPNVLGVSSSEPYGKYAVWIAEADFALGNVSRGQARISAAQGSGGWVFFQSAMVDAILRFPAQVTAAQKTNFRTYLLSPSADLVLPPAQTPDVGLETGGHTGNQWVMGATAQSLAAQLWPLDAATLQKSYVDAELEAWIGDLVNGGMQEDGSNTYTVFYLTSLRSLADFSSNPSLRQKAQLGYEWLLARVGAVLVDGEDGGGPTLRTYDPRRGGAYKPTASSAYAWVMFGGRRINQNEMFNVPSTQSGLPVIAAAVQASLAAYPLPAPLVASATVRSFPQTVRTSHDLGASATARWRNTSYTSATYALSSTARTAQLPTGGSDEQTHEWSLRWQLGGSAVNNTFYVKHPISYTGDGTSGPRGSTPRFPVMQRGRALIGVADAAATDLPELRAIVSDMGNVTLSTPSSPGTAWWGFKGNDAVLVGIKFAKPLSYGSSLSGQGSRSMSTTAFKNSMIVETAPASEYGGSISAFLSALSGRVGAVDESHVNDAVAALIYTTLAGETLYLDASGTRTVNGAPLPAADAWPLLDSAFAHADVGGNTLRVSGAGSTRIYDFASWTSADSTTPTGGDFEAGTATAPSGWTVATWSGSGTITRSSAVALRGLGGGTLAPASTGGNIGWSTLASARPPVTVGKRTTLSVWLKQSGISGPDSSYGSYLYAQYYDAAGNALGTALSSAPERGTTDWHSVALTLPAAPAGAASLYISLRARSLGGVAAFDDLSVTRW